jgi:hypothetical protein
MCRSHGYLLNVSFSSPVNDAKGYDEATAKYIT